MRIAPPTYRRTVLVMEDGDENELVEREAVFIFKRPTASDLAEMWEEPSPLKVVVNFLLRIVGIKIIAAERDDYEKAKPFIVGWIDIEDAAGNRIMFTPATLDQVMERMYIRTAVTVAFHDDAAGQTLEALESNLMLGSDGSSRPTRSDPTIASTVK